MRTLLVGRWQPPHLGHLSLVKQAADNGEVIVVIGSALKANTLKNPFSCGERIEMWRRILEAENIKVIFVTLPDAPDNNTWVNWVKIMCPKFDKAVTGDPLSYKLLSQAGFVVDEPVFFKKEIFNGTAVRDLIISGDSSWKEFVHKEVVKYLGEIDGEERLKNLARG